MRDLVQLAQFFGDVALGVAFVAVLTFTLLYGIRSRWSETAAGRSVFWLGCALSGIVVLVAWAALDRVVTAWDTEEIRSVFRLAAYGFIATACWRMALTLWRHQRDASRDRRRRVR